MAAEVAPATEETAEQVKGVVVLPAAALLPLLEALLAILVVDLARFWVDQGFIGLGDFDEFIFGRFIAPVGERELVYRLNEAWAVADLRVLVGMELLGKLSVC